MNKYKEGRILNSSFILKNWIIHPKLSNKIVNFFIDFWEENFVFIQFFLFLFKEFSTLKKLHIF